MDRKKHPQVVLQLEWSSAKIGIFFSAGLLIGHGNGKEYKAPIV
jgi:hypothetical protein